MTQPILIVDDEPGIRESLRAVLEDEGYAVETVVSGEECLKAIQRQAFELILLDVWLPGIDGLETLARLRAGASDAAVVMISGHGNIETAVRATKLGAYDFVEKPLSLERTMLVVGNVLAQRKLERASRESVSTERERNVMIGESVAMRALRGQINIVAPSDGRVLIIGESGTGKELVARAIHLSSPRASNPFVEVNCAAIPEDLIESELFGHTRGAFTGATAAKRGKFEAADGGTLFLDEIGDMSLRAQAKVLRVLEENCFEPLGATRTVRVDVRVIAATNKRLDAEIERGSFRADLFYRLNVIPFQIPPLRERLEDVPLLVEYFNERFSIANGKHQKRFSHDAMERLCSHSYPGNIRELRNTIERVCIMHQADDVTAEDLPAFGAPGELSSHEPTFQFPSFREASEAYQREFIRRKLAESDGNVTRAAEAMGVDRSHLYRRLRQLGIATRAEQPPRTPTT